MVRLTGSYRCTDQPLVRYISNRTDVPTQDIVGHIDKFVYTTHTSSLSDRHILPILSSILWYNKP